MISFPYPVSTGEWLAFAAAVSVIVLGLCVMIVPRYAMWWLGLAERGSTHVGVSEIRGPLGGVWVGLGTACIFLAQPLTYLALGLSFALAVAGRIISFIFDGSFNSQTALATLYELAVAVVSLKFVADFYQMW